MSSELRRGVLVGVAASLVAVHAVLAWWIGSLRDTFRDLGTVELPVATRVVVSFAWAWGVPAVGATWLLAYAPIYQLAGSIRSE